MLHPYSCCCRYWPSASCVCIDAVKTGVLCSVCHRRSLSDDCLMFGRSNSSSDDSNSNSGGSGGTSNPIPPSALPATAGAPALVGRTPQEVRRAECSVIKHFGINCTPYSFNIRVQQTELRGNSSVFHNVFSG